MAITLISAPSSYKPAFNPIEWVFSSNNYTECDFIYLCDLYVNGALAIRLKTFPEGSNGYGKFQVQRTLQDFLSFNFRHAIIDWTGNANGICEYYLEIRESYNTSSDCTGSVTISSVLYTTETSPSFPKFAWNAALQYKEYDQFTLSKYLITDYTSKFLTRIPNKSLIGLEDRFTIGFLQEDSTVRKMEIKTYDLDGLIIDTYYYSNTQYVPIDYTELLISVGCGPDNLNNVALDSSPTQPIINGNVSYYTISLVDVSGTRISELKRFDIDTRCTPFRKYRLWFLNRLGQFDSYNFDLVNRKSIDISRSEYTKILDTDYSEGDRGQSVLDVDAGENLVFNTNWLTEAEGKWMEELFTSPEVYVVDRTPIEAKYHITGLFYVGGFAAFRMPGEILQNGTVFTYVVNSGAPLGISNTGSGTITGYDIITDSFISNVVASINAGTDAMGTLTVTTPNTDIIPLVITSSGWEEKQKSRVKNIQYSIQAKPSYKLNIQSL